MPHPFHFTHAIARRPAPSAVKGLRADGGPDPDFAALAAEHAGYVAALADAGLAVTVLDPLDAYPDALFVEDPALVFPGTAILLNPGAPSRAGEVAELRPALSDHFAEVLALGHGYADGGDVLMMPGRAFIGLSARTDQAGAAALARLLEGLGLRAEVVSTPADILHLKTGCSLIDDETVLAMPSLAASGIFADYRVLTVPEGEAGGANVLRLPDRVLMGRGYPGIRGLIEGLDLPVVEIETSSIAMIDAGLTCMSLRW